MDPSARLDAYLDDEDLAAAWFARPNAFAWLTGGDNRVDAEADVGVAAAGYDGDGLTVVTDSIEADRLRTEELADDVAVESYPWHERDLASAVADASPRPAAADFEVPGFERIDPSPLRSPLTDEQVDRYRRLGRDAAEAVEEALRDADAGDRERDVAADLRRALASRDVAAPVVLVGGTERAPKYRHFTPTDAELGGYALASVTARRDGLHASLTRTIAFDPPEWLGDRTRAAARVEASALAATRAVGRDGGRASEVFAAIRSAYADVGWAGEWREHHQGGATGYAGREWIATPGSDEAVTLGTAYAWNPTVRGAKSEDTYLVEADGLERLTWSGDWPTIEASAGDRDLDVERPAALER